MANNWLDLMLQDQAMHEYLDFRAMRQRKQVIEAPLDFGMFLTLIKNNIQVQVTERVE